MLEGEELPGSVGASVDRFLDDLTIAGYSPATVRLYGYKLRKRLPLDWPLRELTTALLRSLVAAEVRYAAPGTAATFDTMLRSFSKWLWKQGLTPVNLMAQVPSPKPPEPKVRALSQEAMARLWQAAQDLGPEYAAMFGLLATTGLRRAEVAGARWEDVEGDTLRVLGKGGRWRRVLLTEEVLGLLYGVNGSVGGAQSVGENISHRPVRFVVGDTVTVKERDGDEVGPNARRIVEPPALVAHGPLAAVHGSPSPAPQIGNEPMAAAPELVSLEVNATHRRNPTTRGPIFNVSPSGIGQRFAVIARRAGVKATCHSIRHTFFTSWVASGGQLEAARILGGWSSMAMLTKTYAASAIEDAALAEARRLQGL